MGIPKRTEQNQKQIQGGRPMKTKDIKYFRMKFFNHFNFMKWYVQ